MSKQSQLPKEVRTFTVAFRMDRGPLDMLVQIVHAGKTDAVLHAKPWPEHTRRVTSESGWATTAILQPAAALDEVLNPGRNGQAWILLCDMASIHASEAAMAAMKAALPHVVLCIIPPRSTSYLQPCDLAVFRSFKSDIWKCATTTLARSVIDSSLDDSVMNRASRRQSSAEWASRAVADLCEKNQAWTSRWHRLRAHSDEEFRDAATEAAALHAHGELFANHIELEPAKEGPPEWAMAEESDDDEDDAPMPDAPAPPEHELIAMPLVAAYAPPMSSLGCIAQRLMHGGGPRCGRKKSPPASSRRLSVVSRVGCLVCPALACVPCLPCPDHQSQVPRQ